MNNSNYNFLESFIKIFESEIMFDISQIEFNNIFLLLNKSELNIFLYKECDCIFKGFGRKMKLHEAVDEFEFYYAIISFFNQYGKIYRNFEFKENEYSDFIALSFYNHKANKIEVIQESVEKVTFKNFQEHVHLFYLNNLKFLITKIMFKLDQLNITSQDIKNNFNKFLEIQKQEEKNGETTNI